MHILYVEDNPQDVDLTRRELARIAPDLRLDAVSTLRECLERLEEWEARGYELVLADLRLADGDGLALLAYIRDRRLPLAVVIVTGQGDEDFAVAALKAGADDYVVKQRDYRLRLPLLLRNALERYRSRTDRSARGVRVLYAEHNHHVVDLTRRHLARYAPHIRLEAVSTGEEVLDRLLKADPPDAFDLILLDYGLPRKNALEVVQELRQVCRLDLPVVIVTGQGDEEVAAQALKLDVADYLIKSPGYLSQLPMVIENAVHRAQLAREQEALRRAEQHKAIILSTISEHVSYLDAQLRMHWANRAAEQYAGLSSEQMEGRTCYEIYHRRSEPCDPCPVVRAFATGAPQQEEILGPQGRTWFMRAYPVREESGGVVGVVEVALDITDRKEAEMALAQSEARYRAVMEQSADAIFLVDVDTKRIVRANSAFAQMVGYSPAEALALSLYDFIAADREDIDRRFANLLRNRTPVSFERRYRRKDGSLLDVWINATILSYGGGEAMCTIARDLSERKRAEEALRESEERYRAVMEQSADGIFLVDVDSRRIAESNPVFARMLGYDPQEIRGLHVHDLVAAEKEDIDRRFAELLTRRSLMTYERKYRRKDGSLVDVWVNRNVISYGGREVVCTVVRDLTEKKALEAQILRAQRLESLGLLAGGIAHDLNNILTPILINADLLGRSPHEGSMERMLSSISVNAQRGADIVRQILIFSRGVEGERLSVSVRHLLEEIGGFARETFPRSVSIESRIPDGLWSVFGDPTQLHQLLLNLCLNARDAMEKGGTLTLEAQNLALDEAYATMHPAAQRGSFVLLTVKDTGSGIPDSVLHKIFDPFFTTKERSGGTGLGLSVVHGIVRSHGGFIDVSSQVGGGTEFRIYLPASLPQETPPAEQGAVSFPSGQGELILVAEDEVSIREITQVTLEAYGYRVLSASEGAEAVSLYAQYPGEVRAVITDMAMPVMDGVATVRALQWMDPQVKVIAISGLDAARLIADASLPSVKAFLQKPFTAQRLLETLAEVLGQGNGPS